MPVCLYHSKSQNLRPNVLPTCSLPSQAGSYLRVGVEGGGCSGFQYRYDFDATPPAIDDVTCGPSDAPVIVDGISMSYLAGSTLDYVETLGAAAFEIKNPQAKASCGCGNSFSVAL
jgi:iron-sulfur cluster insertion protein